MKLLIVFALMLTLNSCVSLQVLQTVLSGVTAASSVHRAYTAAQERQDRIVDTKWVDDELQVKE